MVMDLSVRDPVPPSDMEKPAQAIEVKPGCISLTCLLYMVHVSQAYRGLRETTTSYTLNFVCADRPS